MKIHIEIDLTIDLEADKQDTAEVLTTQLRWFLEKHLRSTKHEISDVIVFVN